MLTCGSCTDKDCPNTGTGHSACDVFTQEVQEPELWRPTLEDYNKLEAGYSDAIAELHQANVRIAAFENAVAELVRWAQDERP